VKDLAGLHFRLAVLYAIVAVALGNVMVAQHDFTMRTVHVHLNLLGWVSCALYGVYLRLHPAAAASRLARVHFFVAHIGFVLFVSGLAILALSDEQRGVVPTASGGLVSLLGIILFAALVFRTKTPATI
jgi:cbb3-type cytochrome oxidase subunit 1